MTSDPRRGRVTPPTDPNPVPFGTTTEVNEMSKTTATKTPTADLIGELHRRKERDAAAYTRLVRATADGADVSPEEAERVLAAAGKTVTDLSDAVAAIERRRREDAELAVLPELEAALVAAREAVAAKRQEVAKAVEAMNNELAVLGYSQDQAERRLQAVKDRERQILAARERQRKAEDAEEEERLYGHIDPQFRPKFGQ